MLLNLFEKQGEEKCFLIWISKIIIIKLLLLLFIIIKTRLILAVIEKRKKIALASEKQTVEAVF